MKACRHFNRRRAAPEPLQIPSCVSLRPNVLVSSLIAASVVGGQEGSEPARATVFVER
jgi:hypothetical protein